MVLTRRQLDQPTLLLTVLAGVIAVAALAAGHTAIAAGECGKFFNSDDAETVLGAPPDNVKVKSSPGSITCTYVASRKVDGKLVNGSVAVSVVSRSLLKPLLQSWAKQLCATDNEEACAKVTRAVKLADTDPEKAVVAIKRAFDLVGGVVNLTGVFGGNPAMLWNSDPPFSGSTVVIYLEDKPRIIITQCNDYTNTGDNLHDAFCARKSARIVFSTVGT